MIQKFFKLNEKFCAKIEPHLPQVKNNVSEWYPKTISQILNNSKGLIVLDIGAGKICPFAKYLNSAEDHHIIGVDISDEEMSYNTDLKEKCVADVMMGLPFADQSVDMIVSHSVLEHLPSQVKFFCEARRILKPGGHFIHYLPSRFAPFALINQMLPQKLSKKVLYFFFAESKGYCGFPAYYDHCYYSGMKKLLRKNNMTSHCITPDYYQSVYFRFFIPFFLISVLYELIIWFIKAKNLASHLLVISKKQS